MLQYFGQMIAAVSAKSAPSSFSGGMILESEALCVVNPSALLWMYLALTNYA